jgi:hypothetical protein
VGGRVFSTGEKKINKPIKLKKNQINRLKNHKKIPVWFGFDFKV